MDKECSLDMARILVGTDWYEPLASSAMLETDYERIFARHAQVLFPGWIAVPFKCSVIGDDGETAKPDFALISTTYHEWWVVEVELSHHPFDGHVLPQVRRLATGDYGDAQARILAQKSRGLKLSRVLAMMKGEAPRVLVVMNSVESSWTERLRPYNAMVLVFEVFRSEHDRYAFRISGDSPSLPGRIVTEVQRDAQMPRLMLVKSPAALPMGQEDIVLFVDNRATLWRRVDLRDVVYLMPQGSFTMGPGTKFEIVRDASDNLIIREPRNPRRNHR
jgi:hypothetical protein